MAQMLSVDDLEYELNDATQETVSDTASQQSLLQNVYPNFVFGTQATNDEWNLKTTSLKPESYKLEGILLSQKVTHWSQIHCGDAADNPEQLTECFRTLM